MSYEVNIQVSTGRISLLKWVVQKILEPQKAEYDKKRKGAGCIETWASFPPLYAAAVAFADLVRSLVHCKEVPWQKNQLL